jgi:hypothetical protein
VRLDIAARFIATVTAHRIAIVTSLVARHDAIATNHRRLADLMRWHQRG